MSRTDLFPRISSSRASVAMAVVAVTMAVSATLVSTSPLYAATYPSKDSNQLSSEDFIGRYKDALTTAQVVTSTDPGVVVQDERSRLTATLVLGFEDDEKDPAPTVQVAWDNDASLRAAEDAAVEVSPTGPVAKTLEECRPRPGGGCGVSWTWTIVPRKAGEQILLLTVRPRVFIDGRLAEDFQRRNEDIPITVEVHPARAAFDMATASLDELVLDVPDEATSGQPYVVTAHFPMSWPDADVVAADLVLAPTPGSPPALVTPVSGSAGGDEVTRSWRVTPSGDGVLTLSVTATVSARAGDIPLERTVTRSVSLPVAPTFWDSVDARVKWLGGVVGLVLGLIGLWTAASRLRSRSPGGDGGA